MQEIYRTCQIKLKNEIKRFHEIIILLIKIVETHFFHLKRIFLTLLTLFKTKVNDDELFASI